MPIYKKNKNAALRSDSYFEVFEDKGVKYITIKRSQNFKNIQGKSFEIKKAHVWSYGDSLHKLSQRNYGTFDYWWVIALVNGKPTDAHYSLGDEVFIPRNPRQITEMI